MKKHWWHKSKSHTAFFSVVTALLIITASFAAVYIEQRLKNIPPMPSVGIPIRLQIPSIRVDATVQDVGIDSTGRMGLPNNFTDVSWYKYGPRPGDRGSAVMAGHLDTATDANAVFKNLSLLKTDDDVYVVSAIAGKIRFRVIGKELYDDTKTPLEKIFEQKGNSSRLNLVTCDGRWDPKTKNYSERLVVYTERVLE